MAIFIPTYIYETICTYLLSKLIVGATEIKPGIMMIQHLDYKTNEVIETVMHTEDYVACWEDGRNYIELVDDEPSLSLHRWGTALVTKMVMDWPGS